jgi:uncharacterized membrane protein
VKCNKCGWENPPGASFCSQCGAPLAAAALQTGVASSYGHGWRRLWKNFPELFLSGIIVLVLFIIVGFLMVFIIALRPHLTLSNAIFGNYYAGLQWGWVLVFYAIYIIYFLPLGFGLYFVYMTAARGDRVEIGNIFAAFKNYGNVLLVGILYIVILGGISLLLNVLSRHLFILGTLLNVIWVIFSIIITCKLAFVPYLLLDRNMKAVDSIKTSWEMTSGHAWKVFFIVLLAIPIFIAGFICLLVGVIISAMWVCLALGSLYYAVSTYRPLPEPSAPPASSVPPQPAI